MPSFHMSAKRHVRPSRILTIMLPTGRALSSLPKLHSSKGPLRSVRRHPRPFPGARRVCYMSTRCRGQGRRAASEEPVSAKSACRSMLSTASNLRCRSRTHSIVSYRGTVLGTCSHRDGCAHAKRVRHRNLYLGPLRITLQPRLSNLLRLSEGQECADFEFWAMKTRVHASLKSPECCGCNVANHHSQTAATQQQFHFHLLESITVPGPISPRPKSARLASARLPGK